MLKEERFDHILSSLKKNSKVAYDMLSRELQVSEDTIRRDIEILQGSGLLVKVRGGAILPSKNPLTFQARSGYLSEGKGIIALKAQKYIKKGQTIFMDGGTTLCAIAAHLPQDSNFRVVTNNLSLIPILSKHKGIEIIILGGAYNRITETNTGNKTCEEVKQYVADLYLMGTCAIDSKFGITATVKDDCDVKRAMISASVKRIALSNKEKLESNYSFKVCDLQEIDTLITDITSDDKRLDSYRNLGIKLI